MSRMASVKSNAEFDTMKKEYRLHEDIIRFLTTDEPAGLGLESLADFAELFTAESEVQSVVLDRIPLVKASAVQASRLRQAWRGAQQSTRITEEPCKTALAEPCLKGKVEKAVDDTKTTDSSDESTEAASLKSEEAKEAVQRPASKWETFTVARWRDAVYINRAYFGELIEDTTQYITDVAEKIKLSGRRVSMVEVGCGTGEFVRAVADEFRHNVGLDFNPNFIDFCNAECPKAQKQKVHYLQGDATKLYDILKAEFPVVKRSDGSGSDFWDTTRIITCVGNTIGIIPEPARTKVYEQMIECAGNDGIIIMVYWSARWFGDACLNFYHANPSLCGPFDGSCINLKTTTLTTPSGYCTHWTGADEARAVLESFGLEIISCKEKGKGVLVAARRA